MVPKHIGIVMDGNRRFSRKLMMKPWKGHEFGAKKIEQLLEWCKELRVQELTLYAFSYENFNRPKDEFDYLMNLFKEEFTRINSDNRLDKEGIKVNFIGRISMFPEDVSSQMKKLMEKTKDNDKFILNFAMAYSGRMEVIDAAKRIAEQVVSGKLDIDKINEEVFEDNLYMKDEPDMIIRTGGEHRTSNFLNYQSAYSEWFFVDKMWPEFEKEDFWLVVAEYKQRERRFGK